MIKRGLQKFGLSLLLAGAMFFVSLFLQSSSAFAFSGGGTGTSLDPYEIYTCAQLQEISNDLSADYELLDDIDCTSVTYTAIGNNSTPFTGSLDGNLQTISNITITSGSQQGVFGETNGATLENIKLTNNSISGSGNIGTLVGQATNGIIRNIRAESTNVVTGSGNVGGIVGGASSSSVAISRTFFKGTVSLSGAYGGGILGYGTGAITVSDSYSAGTINGGVSYVGGVVGSFNSGTPVVSRVYSNMEVNGTGLYYGGIIGGFFVGTLQNSFSISDMSANSINSGGLFGVGDGTSTNNYFDEYAAGFSNCADSGGAGCTTVNAGNATPNYFINNNTNPPLDTWNFDYLWYNSAGLPEFPVFGAVQVDIPEATSTSINFGYTFLGAQGTGSISSPEIRFRETGSSEQWTYLSNVQTENFDLTISGLKPATQYTIEIRASFDGVGEYSDWDDGSFSVTTLEAIPNGSTTSGGITSASESQLAETGENIQQLYVFIIAAVGVSGLLLVLRRT